MFFELNQICLTKIRFSPKFATDCHCSLAPSWLHSKENVAPPNAPRNSNTCPILCHTIAMPYAKMHQMIMTGKKTLFGQPSRNAGTKRPESDSIDSLALKVISGKLNRLVKATPIRATSAGAVNGRHFVGSELQCLHKKVAVYLDEVTFWR